MSVTLTDSDFSIVFRISATVEGDGVRYYPIHKIKYKKPLEVTRKEMIKTLPLRIEQEFKKIEDFVISKYSNVLFVKHDYAYYGPYKVEYESLNHTVQGYVFANSDLTVTKNLLARGNIFILESSPFIWRDLSKKKISQGTIKLVSTSAFSD